jgi:hypothetical protein
MKEQRGAGQATTMDFLSFRDAAKQRARNPGAAWDVALDSGFARECARPGMTQER